MIKQMKLDNGLTLEIFDLSRQVAGGRWLVSFEARIEVRVKPEYFVEDSRTHDDLEDIQALLGENATYMYTKERNFIAESEKDTILKVLEERFLDTTLGYLSSPEFPRRLILRRYHEALARQRQSLSDSRCGELKYYH
jgi:hypothetical protein